MNNSTNVLIKKLIYDYKEKLLTPLTNTYDNSEISFKDALYHYFATLYLMVHHYKMVKTEVSLSMKLIKYRPKISWDKLFCDKDGFQLQVIDVLFASESTLVRFQIKNTSMAELTLRMGISQNYLKDSFVFEIDNKKQLKLIGIKNKEMLKNATIPSQEYIELEMELEPISPKQRKNLNAIRLIATLKKSKQGEKIKYLLEQRFKSLDEVLLEEYTDYGYDEHNNLVFLSLGGFAPIGLILIVLIHPFGNINQFTNILSVLVSIIIAISVIKINIFFGNLLLKQKRKSIDCSSTSTS